MDLSGSIGSLLSLSAPLAMALVMVVLARLSKRLGEVTRRPPLYRWFYFSAVIIVISVVIQLIATGLGSPLDSRTALLYDIPLVIGLLIGVLMTSIYWGWLLGERGVEQSRQYPQER
jgi:chromate transport protein ChrA